MEKEGGDYKGDGMAMTGYGSVTFGRRSGEEELEQMNAPDTGCRRPVGAGEHRLMIIMSTSLQIPYTSQANSVPRFGLWNRKDVDG